MAIIQRERAAGLNVVALWDLPSPGEFYPEFLRSSWLVYRWLRDRAFEAVIFQDDSGSGLLSCQAKALGEALASTHLSFYVHGPAQWTVTFREPSQLINPDLILDYAVQYGVEHADRLIVPASYFMDRLRAAGWQAPKRVSVLPYLGAGDAVKPVSIPRHMVYPVHSTDRFAFLMLIHSLSRLRGNLAGVHLTFLCYGAAKDRTHFIKRAPFYMRTYLPDFDWNFTAADEMPPSETETRLWIFSPLWLNLPYPLFETAARGEPMLVAKTGESKTIPGLEETLVDWTVEAVVDRMRLILAGNVCPRPNGLNDLVSESAWDEYLKSVETERLEVAPLHPLNEVRVTVCVAHFNKGPYLMETLESLQAQTHQNLEIIVIDDASDDPDSVRVFENAASHYGSPHWIFLRRLNNIGPGQARNVAASRATGAYLIFFDADDVAFPDMVERLLRAVTQPGVDCVGGSSQRFQEEKGRYEIREMSTYAGGCLEAAILFPPAGAVFIVPKELFDAMGGFKADFPLETHEDWNFHIRLLAGQRRLHVLTEPVFGYRLVDSSRSSVITRNMMRTLEPLLEATPSVREQLLRLTFCRAWMTEMLQIEHQSVAIRFARYIVQTKHSILAEMLQIEHRSVAIRFARFMLRAKSSVLKRLSALKHGSGTRYIRRPPSEAAISSSYPLATHVGKVNAGDQE